MSKFQENYNASYINLSDILSINSKITMYIIYKYVSKQSLKDSEQ